MKAVVVEDANRVCVREVPDPPKPGPYRALTRNVCASICNATDLKIAHRKLYFVTDYPTILGHEGVGRVIEVGRNARSFRVGDLVSRPRASVPIESGLHESWGAFAEYGLVTDLRAMAQDGLGEIKPDRLPDQIPAPPDADPVALTQMVTLRETLSLLRNMGVKAGDSIVIFGAGPVGVSFSILARHIGLDPVIVVGRREEPLRRARAFGRATHVINNTAESVPDSVRDLTRGRGADWAIEAIGADAVMADALASIAPAGGAPPAGRVALYGVPDACEVESPLRRGPHISAAQPNEGAAAEEIFDLVGRGLIPAREFVSHELPMAAVDGLRLVESKQAFKVLLWIGEG
jgi:threonine dehydrogenase-like Zn-dependent dehydrogenase